MATKSSQNSFFCLKKEKNKVIKHKHKLLSKTNTGTITLHDTCKGKAGSCKMQ